MNTRRNGPQKSVTIVDVAREAGVSYATVSRVLNDEAYVKAATRARVLEALRRTGYIANRQARSLRTGRTQMIGLLVRDLGTGYIGAIIAGMDAELATSNYDLVLYTTHMVDREPEHVAALVGGMVDGLLLVLPRDPERYHDLLINRAFPHVLVDYEGPERIPAVVATNYQGGYSAIEYLVKLGHRRIGFVTGHPEMDITRARLAGYLQALRDHGIEPDPALVVEGDFTQPAGYSGALSLLELPGPVTAILAANDVMAFGAMEAVRVVGRRVPQDVSVVGFDDIPQASRTNPPLTTVRQPLEEMGRRAVRLLLAYIADPKSPPSRIELPTELIIRGSCRPLRSSSES